MARAIVTTVVRNGRFRSAAGTSAHAPLPCAPWSSRCRPAADGASNGARGKYSSASTSVRADAAASA